MSAKQKSIEERMKSKVLSGESALFPKKVVEGSGEEGEQDKDKTTPPLGDSNISTVHHEVKDTHSSLEPGKNGILEESREMSPEEEIEALNRNMGGGNALQGVIDHHNMESSYVLSTQTTPYKVQHFKKERLVDTHTQRSYYMENEIAAIIEELAGKDTGFKYRFVNEAIRLLIHQEYPHLVHRLRPR